MHRQLMTKAEKIIGYALGTRESENRPDPATGAIKIKYDDEPKTKYTWKDFTFDQGKISGWTGKAGPVESVLWSRTTSDQSRGRKAELKSAYLSNSKALYAIVELSSSKATSWGNAEYIAKATTGKRRLTRALVILPLARRRSRTSPSRTPSSAASCASRITTRTAPAMAIGNWSWRSSSPRSAPPQGDRVGRAISDG